MYTRLRRPCWWSKLKNLCVVVGAKVVGNSSLNNTVQLYSSEQRDRPDETVEGQGVLTEVTTLKHGLGVGQVIFPKLEVKT